MNALYIFWTQLQQVIAHLGPVEIIDVVVVAFILYQLLRLLRGTQGIQILVGLILLAVVGILSTTFNLILMSWLFKNATFFIIIAVIVALSGLAAPGAALCSHRRCSWRGRCRGAG